MRCERCGEEQDGFRCLRCAHSVSDDDEWEEPESELTKAMNRSIAANGQDPIPLGLLRAQTMAIRRNS